MKEQTAADVAWPGSGSVADDSAESPSRPALFTTDDVRASAPEAGPEPAICPMIADAPAPGRPRRAAELRFIGMNARGELTFLNPEGPGWLRLPPALALLLSFCDGAHDRPALRQLFRGTALDDADVMERALRAFVHARLLEGAAPAAGPNTSAPDSVALYLTHACNLHCRYCFNDAGPRHRDELSTAEWTIIIDDIAAAGVRHVDFLGGEPLLRPDLLALASRARRRGLNTALITNGTLVSESVAPGIAAHFDDVQVSIDGVGAVNDRLRGAGSFQRAAHGLQHLLAQGVPVTVASTLTRINLPAIDDFLSWLTGLGVRRFHCTNLQECGRGRGVPGLQLSHRAYIDACLHIQRHWGDQIAFSGLPNLDNPRDFRARHSCGAGVGSLEINALGQVYPCYQLMTPQFLLGDLRRRAFAEILMHSPALKALRARRIADQPVCGSCDVRLLCGGECIAAVQEERRGDWCATQRTLIPWLLKEGQSTADALDAPAESQGNT